MPKKKDKVLAESSRVSETIRVDREVYQKLQEMATPLQDRPNDVLRRLLKLGPKKTISDKKM